MKQRAKQDDVNQTKCWIGARGWMWMEGYFDTLPRSIRQRLQNSPFTSARHA
jgi:hypothetical protein